VWRGGRRGDVRALFFFLSLEIFFLRDLAGFFANFHHALLYFPPFLSAISFPLAISSGRSSCLVPQFCGTSLVIKGKDKRSGWESGVLLLPPKNVSCCLVLVSCCFSPRLA